MRIDRHVALLAVLCFVCFFLNLGAIGLLDFNEGLYVEAAREMFLRGDYVTGRVNGIPWFDKPPLALWQVAISFRVFGQTEWAARLPVAIASTALVFLTYWAGARWFNRRAGLLAAAMLALSPLYFGTARQMTMDIHQSFWFAVAMFGFFYARTSTNPKAKWWTLFAWAGCGLSFMAKSVPGLFPLFACLVYLAWESRTKRLSFWKLFLETKPILGFLVLLAVVVPWHLAAHLTYGRWFWDTYFFHHHVQLATGKDFGHVQPIWYYIPWLFICFFPWSLMTPWVFRKQRTTSTPLPLAESNAEDFRTFLTIWAGVVFVIFTLMPSKVISYLLPMFPAIALLTGQWLADKVDDPADRGLKFVTVFSTIFGIVMLVAVIWVKRHVDGLPEMDRMRREFPPPVAAMAVHAMIAATVFLVAASVMIWSKRRHALRALIGAMVAFVGVVVTEGTVAFEQAITGQPHELVRRAGTLLQPGDDLVLFIGDPAKPSNFFYLPDELLLRPVTEEKGGGCVLETGTLDTVANYLNVHSPAYVVTDRDRAERLGKVMPTEEIEKLGRWRLLRVSDTSTRTNGSKDLETPVVHTP
jgi:4-amino-4-deoxy-L-arabinose transferase-like glycosyltransferase